MRRKTAPTLEQKLMRFYENRARELGLLPEHPPEDAPLANAVQQELETKLDEWLHAVRVDFRSRPSKKP